MSKFLTQTHVKVPVEYSLEEYLIEYHFDEILEREGIYYYVIDEIAVETYNSIEDLCEVLYGNEEAELAILKDYINWENSSDEPLKELGFKKYLL